MNKKLAVLVKQFPKLSESFIQGEIESLIRAGHELTIISIARPTERVGPTVTDTVLARLRYLRDVPFWRVLTELLLQLIFRPFTTIKTLVRGQEEIPARELGALLALCRSARVSHIHAHYLTTPAALASAAANLEGPTFSISAHAKDIYLEPSHGIASRIKNARFVSTCTEHNANYLRTLAAEPEKIHLVYHGIDTQRFKAANASLANDVPTIVAVGRFKEKKGFDVLIQACAKLLAKGKRFRCHIYGYGDQQAHLKGLIDDLHVADHVELRAPVNHSQLTRILAEADMFALPCRIAKDGDRDGIPNSVLEAMAAELPVVATKVSGLPEVIHSGHNGVLVTSENSTGLAQELEALLDDPGLRQRLGHNARQTIIERFSWHINIQPLLTLLAGSETESQLTLEEVMS